MRCTRDFSLTFYMRVVHVIFNFLCRVIDSTVVVKFDAFRIEFEQVHCQRVSPSLHLKTTQCWHHCGLSVNEPQITDLYFHNVLHSAACQSLRFFVCTSFSHFELYELYFAQHSSLHDCNCFARITEIRERERVIAQSASCRVASW